MGVIHSKHATARFRSKGFYMKQFVAFDLIGTVTGSRQELLECLAQALTELIDNAGFVVISGGDCSQFQKQVASKSLKLPDIDGLWLRPNAGTKHCCSYGEWRVIYPESLEHEHKQAIVRTIHAAEAAGKFAPEETWGERVEDRGADFTYSTFRQQTPIKSKENWNSEFAK